MASTRFTRPPLSEDQVARQAIEILLCAPELGAGAPRPLRRLAIVGPAPSESDFCASLQFSRLSAHFQRRFLSALARAARAAVLDLCQQPFLAPPPDTAVSGGSGAVMVSFRAPQSDPDARAEGGERDGIWRSRWDRAQSMIEQEALPEWICLHFLAEGARIVAARDERGESVGLPAQPSDFLASSAVAQFAARERGQIAEAFSLASATGARPSGSEARRL